ncbi:hypothetical protein GYMLUDRAFT_707323 [Collybiopsis luxurians FD-317 M1]|uniref:Uncharacterized protein n=1 Tax=Collybiopsis luxurians FD-317 M1 TaxID=944289 RepID=A0A0D0B4C5_9AGAR|nr:hypothetical protein GYMLUDRAFT_707323 [Collybiopsis luxurians FD-317 M1]
MAQQPSKYPHDIPSLASVHHSLDAYPECTASVARNALLDIGNVNDAEKAIHTVNHLLIKNTPNVTGDMAQTARLRYATLVNIHATDKFGGGDIATILQQLQQTINDNNNLLTTNNDRLTNLQTSVDNLTSRTERIEGRLTNIEGQLTNIEGRLTNVEGRLTNVEGRLTNIEHRLDTNDNRLLFEWANAKARAVNFRRHGVDRVLIYKMKKTITGQGNVLVHRLRPNTNHVYNIAALANDPPLGSEATYNLADVASSNLSRVAILGLVLFYNEDFGMNKEDSLEVWQDKVFVWHTT